MLETRQVEDGAALRRRRICSQGHRFTSWESAGSQFVRKRQGWLERFDEGKLRRAIEKASLEASPPIDADPVVLDVVRAMHRAPLLTGDAISTFEIGRIVLRRLHEQDPTGICALRFGSVFLRHRHFNTQEELIAAIATETQGLMLYVAKSHERERLELAKRGRVLEAFNHGKLRRAIKRALDKTPYEGLLEQLVDEVAATAHEQAQEVRDGKHRYRVIDAEAIGRLVLQRLHATDWVAYARFLSVFNRDEFERVIPMRDRSAQGRRTGTPLKPAHRSRKRPAARKGDA